MARKRLKPAQGGTGSGIEKLASFEPENTAADHPGQGVIDLQAFRLRKRFGLNEATSRLLSSHAFGDRDDDYWISLADAAAMAIDNSARAMEARS